MGYDIEGYLKYEKKYSATINALNYLYISHAVHNGDKEKMLETCKKSLSLSWSEPEISKLIQAIKIIKRNLTIKTGIKNE